MTEHDGKATGWKAFFRDGRWEQEQGPAGRGRRRSANA
jgi:DNA topoisomerase-1